MLCNDVMYIGMFLKETIGNSMLYLHVMFPRGPMVTLCYIYMLVPTGDHWLPKVISIYMFLLMTMSNPMLYLCVCSHGGPWVTQCYINMFVFFRGKLVTHF